MDINITLRDPDEARKAVALACELVSARVLAWRETGPDGAMPPVLREALGRAVAEVLEGELSPDALAERIALPSRRAGPRRCRRGPERGPGT
jgi:hypothetical protein